MFMFPSPASTILVPEVLINQRHLPHRIPVVRGSHAWNPSLGPRSFLFITFLLLVLSVLSERRATARRMLSGHSHSQYDGWQTPPRLFRCGLPGEWRSGEGSILVKHVQQRSLSEPVRQRPRRC